MAVLLILLTIFQFINKFGRFSAFNKSYTN